MMDCVEAQEIISAALDGEVDDGVLLERAKDHCRTCHECGRYVRTLVLVRRAAAPVPPPDLADRIMAAVRSEAISRSESETPLESPAEALRQAWASEGPPPESAVSAATVLTRIRDLMTDPRNRRAVVAWSAAAAVALVATGFGAVAGVRTIMGTRATAPEVLLTYEGSAASQVTPEDFDHAQRSATATPPQPSNPPAAAAPTGFIVVDGVAYRSTGIDGSVKRSDLTPQGSTDTALDSGAFARRRIVYGRGDPSRVFVENDDGALIGFDRVTTSFAGNTYVLRSGAIPSFADGVTLPRDVPEPASPDGRPVFTPVDPELTPPVYVRTGTDPSRGIALPPGARPDVSAGWTFWTPVSP